MNNVLAGADWGCPDAPGGALPDASQPKYPVDQGSPMLSLKLLAKLKHLRYGLRQHRE
jgi:hypothetical protein